MQFVTLISIIASALQVQADYFVASKFDADTTTPADAGVKCESTELEQMVCLDPTTFGQTIFDTTVPGKDWTTVAATDIYASTTMTPVPTVCATGATGCLVHPSVTVAETKLVAIADTTKLATAFPGPAGNCLVNMFYGDYPFVVAGSVVPDRKSGNYTTLATTAPTVQDCQAACINSEGTTEGTCALWTYLYKTDMADSTVYTAQENCFLQSQRALDQLNQPNDVNDCGFNHNLTIGFPSCTANSDVKVCALYTGYAVSGLIACDPTKTPTATWMQTNSICSTVTPTTDPSASTSTAAVVTTVVDPSAPTQTTTNTGSGVSARVVMTSIAALAIGVSTLLL